MDTCARFLQALLFAGRVVLRGRPAPFELEHRSAAVAVLEQAYTTHRLQVAGEPLALDETTVLAAAEVVQQACWFLVNRDQPDEDLEKALCLPDPQTPAQHLSADLSLRFLPQIHRRSQAVDPSDKLTALLADLLRRWPLSGVLSEVSEGPLTPLDFSGHAGLLLLYAERLSRHPRPAWIPEEPIREYLRLVQQA